MTNGQRKLHALFTSGGAQAHSIAAACGVSQLLVVDWSQGKYSPDPVSRAVMEKDFGIPAQDWRREVSVA